MPQLLCVKKKMFLEGVGDGSLWHKLGQNIISGHLYYLRLHARIVSQQVYHFESVFEALQLPYRPLTLGMRRSKSPKWWVQNRKV
jgi:hypothetical protein